MIEKSFKRTNVGSKVFNLELIEHEPKDHKEDTKGTSQLESEKKINYLFTKIFKLMYLASLITFCRCKDKYAFIYIGFDSMKTDEGRKEFILSAISSRLKDYEKNEKIVLEETASKILAAYKAKTSLDNFFNTYVNIIRDFLITFIKTNFFEETDKLDLDTNKTMEMIKFIRTNKKITNFLSENINSNPLLFLETGKNCINEHVLEVCRLFIENINDTIFFNDFYKAIKMCHEIYTYYKNNLKSYSWFLYHIRLYKIRLFYINIEDYLKHKTFEPVICDVVNYINVMKYKEVCICFQFSTSAFIQDTFAIFTRENNFELYKRKLCIEEIGLYTSFLQNSLGNDSGHTLLKNFHDHHIKQPISITYDFSKSEDDYRKVQKEIVEYFEEHCLDSVEHGDLVDICFSSNDIIDNKHIKNLSLAIKTHFEKEQFYNNLLDFRARYCIIAIFGICYLFWLFK